MKDRLQRGGVVLVGGFPPPHGGIAVHVAALRERLAAQGVPVCVLDVGGRRRKAPGVVPVGGPAALAAGLALHAARGWLVHVHISGHTRKSWMVAAAGAVARRPFGPAPLLTLHSGLVPTWLSFGESERRLTRAVASAYGRVVVVNPAIAEALAGIGVPAESIVVAPAFTGEAVAGQVPEGFDAVRARRKPLIAAAIAPSPIYGTRVLMAALPAIARRMPELGAAVFGPVSAGAVRDFARRYGVEGRVDFLGELTHGEALAVIAASDLFVRPSLADGDALSVREALALGTPVVASAVGFRPEGTRLFRPGDSLELARRVEEALLAGARAAPRRVEGGIDTVIGSYRRLWERAGGPGAWTAVTAAEG